VSAPGNALQDAPPGRVGESVPSFRPSMFAPVERPDSRSLASARSSIGRVHAEGGLRDLVVPD
jgi:hypothetical protein